MLKRRLWDIRRSSIHRVLRISSISTWRKSAQPGSWRKKKFAVSKSFIHSDHFYSVSSSPLLLRSAPDTARILCRSFTPKRHRQLQVIIKDLPKVPKWRLERDSNMKSSGRKTPNFPLSHHAPLSYGYKSTKYVTLFINRSINRLLNTSGWQKRSSTFKWVFRLVDILIQLPRNKISIIFWQKDQVVRSDSQVIHDKCLPHTSSYICHRLLKIWDPSHKLHYTFEQKINNSHNLNFQIDVKWFICTSEFSKLCYILL